MNATIASLREQLQQLDRRKADAAIDDADYAAAKSRIERELLAAVVAAPEAPRRPSRAMTASIVSATVVVAVVGYLFTGSPGVPSGAATQPALAGTDAATPLDEQQFAEAVDKLAQRMQSTPDDADGWSMLARSYGMLGRFADAVPAYAKAVALRGDDARLLVDYADALALSNDRDLSGEPTKLIDRALAIDPDNLKALSLAGAAAFNRGEYTAAVRHWERVVALVVPDSPVLPQLQAGIAEARQRGGMAPAQVAAAPVAATASTAAAARATDGASAATVTGTVRLSAALAARAAPDDTVFIYARPVDGPRMPVAIVRTRVRDLPATFTLDDSSAMSPASRLSMHPQVVVTARVSRSGQAAPAAGDLVGESPPVDHGRRGLVVEIGDVVR